MSTERDNNKKFLFDLNNFDTPVEEEIDFIEEEIEVEPPPPMFSEDELEAARSIAHSKGLTEGRAEEKASREEFISNSLNTIAESFSSLFAAELYREKQYEEEALKLGLKIIDLIAPSLNDRLGEEALKNALSDVLKRQSEQTEIRIETHPESTSEIDAYIEKLWPDASNAPRYKIVANSDIEKGACNIFWQDGGMTRDPQKTSNDIKEAIEALLSDEVLVTDQPAKTNPVTKTQKNAINEDELPDSSEKFTSEEVTKEER